MMMKYLLPVATMLASTIAKNVVCMVDDEPVATVDLDTGICPFALPADSPVAFDFTSADDYNVIFYYATVEATKYFTDIVNEGLTIQIPANLLYGKPSVPYFEVSDSKTPQANSTEALRKRLLGKTALYSRDAESDFVDSIKQEDGEEVTGSSFSVVDESVASSIEASESSSAADVSGTETVTDIATTVVTITSCSDDKCSETAVTTGLTTVTDETTIYTTYCPLSGEETVTDISTTVVTITSCSDDKCHETAVTTGVTTITDETTVYTTYCPLTAEGTTTSTEIETTVVTITSCADDKCAEMAVTTGLTTVTDETTVYTTYCPLSSEEAAASESYETTSTEFVTSYVTITSCGPEGCEEKSMVETVTTVTVNGVETAYTTYCPVEGETTVATTSASVAPVPKPVTNSTTTPVTVAPETTKAAGSASIDVVCTGEACAYETTTTVQSTVVVSVSASNGTESGEVSTFEGAANNNVGGVASVVALVGAIVYLL